MHYNPLRQKFTVTSEDQVRRNKALNKFRTLVVSGGDSKGVDHVSGSGWRRLSAIMDSGSAECVAPEDMAKSIPLVET